MTVLAKRRKLNPGAFNKRHPLGRAFLAPQRAHPAKAQHPKPARAAGSGWKN